MFFLLRKNVLATIFLFAVFLQSGFAKDSALALGSDFDERIADFDTALVMFFAPWCGHCKMLKPEFEKAAKILKDNDPPVQLVKVNCDTDSDVCDNYRVEGYPTLKIFKNGVASEYNGPRKAGDIVKYMKGQAGPAAKELDSVQAAEAFTSKDVTVLVGFFESNAELKKVFLELAGNLRGDVSFAQSSNSEVLEKFGHKDNVVLFRAKYLRSKFEPDTLVYEGGANITDLSNWLMKNYHGLCGVRTTENMFQFRHPHVVAYYSVDYVNNAKSTNYWRNRILKVAQNFKDDFAFAISNNVDFEWEFKEFGVEKVTSGKPTVLARNAEGRKFVMKDEFSMENFQKFLTDLKEGKIEPYIKSEPIPTQDGPVTIAVAKNFDEVITKSGKDALIEFYSPQCNHCKKLAPVYDKLGAAMKDEDVIIAKFNVVSNDRPSGYGISKVPAIYWLPKDGTPREYNNAIDLDDFIKFIAENASNELKSYDREGKPKASKEEL